MIKKLTLAVVTALMFVGCSSSNEPGPVPPGPGTGLTTFLAKTNEGVYVNGADTYKYDESIHQVAVNPTRKTYRIQTDTQSEYLNCVLSALPANLKDSATLTLSTAGITGITAKAYTVTLEKKTANTLWLWEESSSTGFIITL